MAKRTQEELKMMEEADYVLVDAESTNSNGQLTTNGFHILRDGKYLTNKLGVPRLFISRCSARKRITRERKGDFR